MAAFGAPVDGWPNSMWMTLRPSAFSWCARRLIAMAWKGSTGTGIRMR